MKGRKKDQRISERVRLYKRRRNRLYVIVPTIIGNNQIHSIHRGVCNAYEARNNKI